MSQTYGGCTPPSDAVYLPPLWDLLQLPVSRLDQPLILLPVSQCLHVYLASAGGSPPKPNLKVPHSERRCPSRSTPANKLLGTSHNHHQVCLLLPPPSGLVTAPPEPCPTACVTTRPRGLLSAACLVSCRPVKRGKDVACLVPVMAQSIAQLSVTID